MRKNVPVELMEDAAFLCSNCKTLGFCRRRAQDLRHDYRRSNPQAAPLPPIAPSLGFKGSVAFSEREIKFWVPLKTQQAPAIGGKMLQKAHDLFHEEEYEQASYVYRDLLQTRNDYQEALLGLAASLYFLGKYEEATVMAMRLSAQEQTGAAERFLKSCEKAVQQQVERRPAVRMRRSEQQLLMFA